MGQTISELGGERGLVQRITTGPQRKDVLVSSGDDAAVVSLAGQRLAITTDMLVEGDHFTTSFCPPEHVGKKVATSSLSDIAAMGGTPQWAVVSICLSPKTDPEWVEATHRGLRCELGAWNADLVGGDITHGDQIVISLTLVGVIDGEPILRSGAKPGDMLWVTGPLGGARAGLRALQEGIDGFEELKGLHTAPSARLDVATKIKAVAHAAIDISDGLASEVRHIATESGVGAILRADQIPLSAHSQRLARLLGEDPLDYALSGGEDFQILFAAKPGPDAYEWATCVGQVIAQREIFLEREGSRAKLTHQGFDHFR